MNEEQLADFLADHPPFDSMSTDERTAAAAAGVLRTFGRGALVLDAFTKANDEVMLVVSGRVEVWNDTDWASEGPDEILEAGGAFGFSAMLTGRSIGPRAVAAVPETVVACFPGPVVAGAFTSQAGAEFLAARITEAERRNGEQTPGYALVDDLLERPPLVVAPKTRVDEVARRMTEAGVGYAVVLTPGGEQGLITDEILRSRVLTGEHPGRVAAATVMAADPPTVALGSSAAEALILMLDRQTDHVLVVDRDRALRGVVAPSDFLVSTSTTAGVSLNEQLRRAESIERLRQVAGDVPALLRHLFASGLASPRVITIYSALIDTMVRRSLALVFEQHPELSVDAFTWLSLGSNGRREAVPSSDIDAAVAFDDAVKPAEIERYLRVFTEVNELLGALGLSSDPHGAFPSRRAFARTNDEWRQAARHWLAAPEKNQGAMMTSLLVDGRPIHGDPGLPEVTRVFGDLRAHQGTMKLLLQESLAKRARPRGVRTLLSRHHDSFDVKEHALLPIVNLARWLALSAGSVVLPTTERLRSAAGSEILPVEQGDILVEVFEVLQRLRLRYQVRQLAAGEEPSDVIGMDRLSAIDRSIITRAVREISAVQKRADNIAMYSEPDTWTAAERR